MKMNTRHMIILLAAALISGCSSTSSRQDAAKDEIKAQAIRAEAVQEKKAKAQHQAEEMIQAVPAWSLEPPKPDGTGVYAVGMADSEKLPIALRKAMLQGEFGLAKIYSQEISGSERSYVQDNGKSGVTEQFTGLIDKLVMQVPLSGIEVVRQEIKPIDGTYHAFVLLKLPYDQFNEVLHNQRTKTRDTAIAAAFDDLERRIKERRKQRQEDAAQVEPAVNAARADRAPESAGTFAPSARDVSPLVEPGVAPSGPPSQLKEQ
ncbi:hypothetical protein [Duganella vulcania]|uniref:Lipoprotein n=1 Tax=Duganella vulcania TaxID=2692166 RepID=A0A845GI63_9BURK|nr:hypothetical protein [Duganella vulcania]MYM92748.1 hypothetical protein [Duganella vulcania]